MNNRIAVGILTLLIVAGPVLKADDIADPLPRREPADVQMDAAQLSKASRLIDNAIKNNELRGAVVLVARRGKVVLHEAYGW